MSVRVIYKICIIIACAFAFCNAADYPDEKSDDDPIFAYFCFYKDVVSWIKNDSVYALSYYEMQNEFTISVDYKSTTSSSIFGVNLPDLDQKKNTDRSCARSARRRRWILSRSKISKK